jgi:hypothetical protein
MTDTITLILSGLNNQAAGKAFGDKLTELVKKVSGGFQTSGYRGAFRSTYEIAMQNSMGVKAFADQITWGGPHGFRIRPLTSTLRLSERFQSAATFLGERNRPVLRITR